MWQQTADQSIIAFASVRNNAATSDPSFGDWLDKAEQATKGTTYAEDIVPAMIEVTRGSPNKYEVDKETGQLMLDRVLHSSVYYPGDYGYVPQTLCGDGDPLDILIVTPAESGTVTGLDTGCMALCRVVGLMDMEDESGRDEKLIAVLDNQRSTDHVKELHHVPQHLQREIQHFFENYKRLEKKKGKAKWAKVLGWSDRARAVEVVKKSRQMYLDSLDDGKKKFHPFVRVPKCPSMLHVKQESLGDGEGVTVTCYVNVSKGSMNSYIYRQDTTYRHYKYTLDMPYPGDYGWICQTWQTKCKKPVEILVLTTFPLSPESLADVKLIGAIERSFQSPTKGGAKQLVEDIKVVAVLAEEPRMSHVTNLSDLNPQAVNHFCSFFVHSAEMAGCSECKINRQMDAQEALQRIRQAHKEYNNTFQDKDIHNAPNLWCLPWGRDATDGPAAQRVYPAIVECSKHTSNRYNFNTTYGVLKCSGAMRTSTFWPGNYGFIPQTVAEDGAPVNVMILSTVPLTNGSVAEVRIVGAAECSDELGPDMKLIGVPKSEPRMKEWDSIEAVPGHIKDEMVHFWDSYKDLHDDWKFCRFERWIGAEAALEYIKTAHSQFFLFVMPMQRMQKRLRELEEENTKLKMLRQK